MAHDCRSLRIRIRKALRAVASREISLSPTSVPPLEAFCSSYSVGETTAATSALMARCSAQDLQDLLAPSLQGPVMFVGLIRTITNSICHVGSLRQFAGYITYQVVESADVLTPSLIFLSDLRDAQAHSAIEFTSGTCASRYKDRTKSRKCSLRLALRISYRVGNQCGATQFHSKRGNATGADRPNIREIRNDNRTAWYSNTALS